MLVIGIIYSESKQLDGDDKTRSKRDRVRGEDVNNVLEEERKRRGSEKRKKLVGRQREGEGKERERKREAW